MNISVSRDGMEIGEWTEEEVRSFYAEGRLVATDCYWKEGMPEWASLASFIKPPPPFPASAPPPWFPTPPVPAPSPHSTADIHPPFSWYDHIKNEGIGRLAYVGLIILSTFLIYVISFGMGYFIGYYTKDVTLIPELTECIQIAAALLMGVLSYLRLINIGYDTQQCVVGTLCLYLPLIGLITLCICLFKSPGSAIKKS
jgi:hypothetical protein